MLRLRLATLALTIAALDAAPSAAQRVTPNDFAAALELASEHAQPVHVFTLEERVLRALVDRGLGDLCVFDEQGEQLAHSVSAADEGSSRPSEIAVSAYFPLETASAVQRGDVEVSVERDTNGAITRAYSRPVIAAETRVSGYLVDLSALVPAWSVEAVTLPLRAAHAFTSHVVLESSEDLASFEPLTTSTLAWLEHNGRSLRKEIVKFPRTRARYLRLTFLDPPKGLALEGLSVRVRPVTAPPKRRFIELDGSRLPDASAQLFLYPLEGAIRPDRYDVRLPAKTTLIEAQLESAPRPEGPFRVIDRAVFRREGRNERAIAPGDDTFFRLRVGGAGGGVHSGSPTLRLGYRPPRLLFAHETDGPYLLAYGSGRARCQQFDKSALEKLAGGALPTRDSVHVVDTRTLAGEQARARPEPPRSSRVFVLWAVLLVAVGVLGWVARKLLRKA